ncbi:hypothetical protein NDN08_003503 [Rhodosorus marinus]|uniref:AAA+ ATPase domain-containing protein n=1 Tax=Rhodosorus marinus TaxID=101924 RepID=A0AAV8UWP8_9RHOD|nr:hypothetical protein NDN08_003503 [Rhodosorus marinus]
MGRPARSARVAEPLFPIGRVVKKAERNEHQLKKTEPGTEWWRRSQDRLSLSFVPDKVLGRESEALQLKDTLEGILKADRGGAVYVSGLPGTGKTLTVKNALREVGYRSIWVNCASQGEPRAIYGTLCDRIKGSTTSESTEANLIATLSKKGKKTILVLDELDFLITRDLSLLYAVFELPKKCSEAIVLGIANSVDLPERLLPWLRACQSVPVVFPFRPYTSDAMEKIILQRIEKDVMDLPAIKLCAKKTAAVNGDVRLALDVCRAAIDSVKNKPSRPKTFIAEIVRIFESRGSVSGVRRIMENLPIQQQVMLCSFVRKLSDQKRKEATLGSVYDEYQPMSLRAGTSSLTFGEFSNICNSSLSQTGLVEVAEAKLVKRNPAGRSPRRQSSLTSPRTKLLRLCVAEADVRECFQARRLLRDLLPSA